MDEYGVDTQLKLRTNKNNIELTVRLNKKPSDSILTYLYQIN